MAASEPVHLGIDIGTSGVRGIAIDGAMLVAVVYLITQMRLASARNAILDKLEESTGTLREMLAEQLREERRGGWRRSASGVSPTSTHSPLTRPFVPGVHARDMPEIGNALGVTACM